MSYNRDPYPSRTNHRIEPLQRRDPVIHAGARIGGPLSAGELATFEHDGFLILDSFFSREESAAFAAELRRLSGQKGIRERDGTILEPGSDEVRSIFEIHKLSGLFRRLAADARIQDRVRQIVGGDVYMHQSRINYKPGFKGKGFNWHSDFETWHAEDGMPQMRAVSCSILLTDNDEYNGPLMLIPGSHRIFIPCLGETPEDNYRLSLKDQTVGVPDTEALSGLVDHGGLETFKGPAGSMLLFECNTLHGSNANMSPFPRSNVFFVYNSVDNGLQQPFAATRHRPSFLAEREVKPLRRAA